jgi:signal transduction histidine kinase/FixJ family two-component response regulator
MAIQLLQHSQFSRLDLNEQVQADCTAAMERIEAGDYDAGCAALRPWWKFGEWPRHDLDQPTTAQLLLTAGKLSDSVARARQVSGGSRLADALLNGAIALFEHLGDTKGAAESRTELASSYYHQGLFDLAHATLSSCLATLSDQDRELKAVASIRLAIVDRHSGRLQEALNLLNETAPLANAATSWTKGRFHMELANALRAIGLAENRNHYLDKALSQYQEASQQFEIVGNLRSVAAVENNRGYLLLTLRRFDKAQIHLARARKLFDELGDRVGCAQVDDTLAQLYLASERFELAHQAIGLAVHTLENTEEEALLAEALTTQGLVLCRLGRRHEARPALERARRVAERCGDNEGAGRALLILIEEMCEQLGDEERRELGGRANQLLANSQQQAIRERLHTCLERITAAHAEFEQQREQAVHAEKMAALGELSFGVAHNVNNTLTGILGRAQLLLRTKDPQKISLGIERIIQSAEDGAHIIRRIQDFARKQPSRQFQAVSVAALMKDVCEMSRPRWEAQADGPKIRVALFADCVGSLMGDAVELREVLVNMIYNAIDAMPSGGEIRMSSQEVNGRVVLTIADSGTGMTPEVKSRLFDPFFTTKGKGGTGMGMAVSFGIIRRHNGSIDVESEPGRGTTFRISLPVAELAEARVETDSATADALSGSDKIRALVVDDESAVREVLREALEAEGCEVLVAESGEIALKLYDFHGGKIDVVFTDIGMPEMSGWELASEIRKRSSSVPLAIVSGWADAISCDARQAIKADWVVSKPFDIATIAAIAKEVIERRENRANSKPEPIGEDVRALLGMG